jgi:HAMP domain-containing protein
MTSPAIPVSWGELLDKIAILQIKSQRLRAPAARANAAHELALLRQAGTHPQPMPELEVALLAANTRLWRIEDLIREKEAAGDFGPAFVALARAVYHENDERGRIKQAINRLLQSALVEEKQYSQYQP